MAKALEFQVFSSESFPCSRDIPISRFACPHRTYLGMTKTISFTRFRSSQRIIIPRAQTETQDRSEPPFREDAPKWWEKDLGASIQDIHSSEELEEMVAKAEGKLVVVEFFASWCGSCRALYPKLCKLVAENQDIVFLKVNFDESKILCKSLDVKILPYFHFYKGGTLEKLDSFSCNIVKLKQLKDAIIRHNVGASMGG